jgi:hypothetical protein
MALRSLFTLRNPLHIALASNYKTRSARMMMMVMVIILAVTSRRRRRRGRRVTAAVPPTVTTRMTMMTTTTIKSVITMKVYDLLNDVSFLLPIMVPP